MKLGGAVYRADFRDIKYRPVLIGTGTWICANCVILPGVKIGKGCVIAAGAVVVKDCKDNSLYAGNPARFIKSLL